MKAENTALARVAATRANRVQGDILLVSAGFGRAGLRARSHRRPDDVVKTPGDLSGHPASFDVQLCSLLVAC